MRVQQLPRGLLLLALLATVGCGGGGGGSGAGGGGSSGGGGGGLGNQAPTASIVSPITGIIALPRDRVPVSFVSNDPDDDAEVRIFTDRDGDLSTQSDQVDLYVGVDGDGAQSTVTLTVRPQLAAGAHTLVLRVKDSAHPAVDQLWPAGLVLHDAVAGVAMPRSNRYGIAGGTAIFSRGEAEDAGVSLNGDADTADGVYASLNLATGSATTPVPGTAMDVGGVGAGDARPIVADDGVLSWLTFEANEGRNLNGANVESPAPPIGGPDVDALDTLLTFVAPAISNVPITNTFGGANTIVDRVGGLIVVHYQEAGEGNPGGGTDLNFDADAADAMFGYVDPAASGASTEFNQIVFCSVPAGATAGATFRAAGRAYAALRVSEAASAPGLDINADGDQADAVLWLGDLLRAGGTGAPAAFFNWAGGQLVPAALASPVDPLAAFDVSTDGYAAYYVDEAADNTPPGLGLGNDRNADRLIGMVPTLYQIGTGTELVLPGAAGPLNSGPGTPTMLYAGTRVFFTAAEAPRLDPVPGGGVLGTNGDGDNGADLAILYWADHAAPAPVAAPVPAALGGAITLGAVSLDGGGSLTALAPGWLALIVSEAANGGQDINGSGALDFAWLLIDTTTPVPTIHNPGIVPSAAGSMPLAGVPAPHPDAAQAGVVLRLTEAANGVLDGDGNATEIFFAFVGFQNPTSFQVFDGGGDHCYAAGGLIAVTANEAFTGEDYDGNSTASNTVFRVFAHDGSVVEAGRLCSPLSVPTTEDGSVWAFLRDEAVEGRMLNADSDTADLILGLWRR